MILEPVVPPADPDHPATPERAVLTLRSTLFPDTPRSPYAPGPLRHDTDAQHAAVCAFCRDNTEFSSLPAEVVAQYMDRRSGFKTDAEMAERQLLADEGVPVLARTEQTEE